MSKENTKKLKVGEAIWVTQDNGRESDPAIITFIIDDDGYEDTIINYLTFSGFVGLAGISDVVPMGFEFPEFTKMMKEMEEEAFKWNKFKLGQNDKK